MMPTKLPISHVKAALLCNDLGSSCTFGEGWRAQVGMWLPTVGKASDDSPLDEGNNQFSQVPIAATSHGARRIAVRERPAVIALAP